MATRRGFLEEQQRALEDAFLRRSSDAQRARFGGRRRRRPSRDELARTCGVGSREVLDPLLRLGLTPESVAAFSIVPLLAVAWAPGRVEEPERQAWLDGAAKCGVEEGTPARELLAAWLAEPPDRELFETWTRFAKALCDHLDDGRRERLREHVVGRARAVARAAGEGAARPTAEEERELAKLGQLF